MINHSSVGGFVASGNLLVGSTTNRSGLIQVLFVGASTEDPRQPESNVVQNRRPDPLDRVKRATEHLLHFRHSSASGVPSTVHSVLISIGDLVFFIIFYR